MKKIIKALQSFNELSDWRIINTKNTSNQAFYVHGKLETKRLCETNIYNVTVYVRQNIDGNITIGQSSFVVSHKLTSKELNEEIRNAIESSKYIKNKDYQLVKGFKKKTFKSEVLEADVDNIFNEIIEGYNAISTTTCKFNAVEIFIENEETNIVNSQNVNLTKKTNKIMIEAIPSYDGNQNVELYKFFEYHNYNKDKILEDAKQSLEEVSIRYNAVSMPKIQKLDVIIKDETISNFLFELISTYNYNSVYNGSNFKNIGEFIQPNISEELLTIKLDKKSKCDAFDADGVLLNKTTIVDKGILTNYFGVNQYANYINIQPTGNLNFIELSKGKKTYENLTKKPYIEIYALSGLQMDIYNGYIGGEVRLAIYFDGEKKIPVSGFSFSGNIINILETLELSKETIEITNYRGPKYLKLKNLNIVS